MSIAPKFPSNLTWPDLKECGQRLSAEISEIRLPNFAFSIASIQPFLMPKGRITPQHAHSFYEANYIVKGSAKDLSVRQAPLLRAGSVFFHTPNVEHTWRAYSGACMRIIVRFMVTPVVRAVPTEEWPCWPWLLNDLAHIFLFAHERPRGWKDSAAGKLAFILTQTLTLADLPTLLDKEFHEDDQFVETVNHYINDNYNRPIMLSDIAFYANVSMSCLTHRYKKLTNNSLCQKIMSLRLEATAQLLRDTRLSLKEICPQVGIADTTYLCRLFKRYYQQTPNQYRRVFTE